MFKLVISDDEGKTTVVPLVRDEITIGRKEGNTIRLTERNVSRRHARLQRANGAYVLEDLSSYNGVRINGQRIGDATALKAGDQVAIGDYLIALQSEEVAAAPPPPVEKPPPARLVMLTPPAPGAEFALHDGAQRIGRAEDLDIWVNHRSISREHAEVTSHEDGILSIRDLASANGMRVNGEDRTEAEIEPGDVVELGQVRFRYVGAGEKYAFEADRTVAMDAVVLPDAAPPSKAPVYVALAIVLLAVAVGAGIALQGGDPDPVARPIEPTPDMVDPDPTDDSDQEATLAALTDRCASLVREGDYEGALTAANDALRVSPLSSFASMCRDQATQGVETSRAFDEGVRLWNEGDASAAWAQVEDINNPAFLDREEYDQIRQAYLTATLDRAENNPRDAEEHLREVDRAAVPSEDEEYLARAAEIRRGGSQLAVVRPNTMRPNTMRPDTSTQVAVMTPTMAPEMSTSRPSASEVVQACRFEAQCIIRGIGSPRNAGDYAQLIEAHRRERNVAAKRRLIQQFLARYPSDARAVRYQRELQ